MKWYMALNEGGTRGDIAFHTKLAILSGSRYPELQPRMLYTGERNEFTRWMEERSVEVMDQSLPYLDLIEDLSAAGRYSTATVGHWLRTNVCLAESEDEHVLYTDVDVFFRRSLDIERFRPKTFAAAPEFDRESWNYFNAGVMVANIPFLRQEYRLFEEYIRDSLQRKTYNFHDQIAYNEFYRYRWERLPLSMNWKPYWGIKTDVDLVHFHGPKIGAIEAILDGRWDWSTDHGRQIGSLFVAHLDSYRYYLTLLLNEANELSEQESDRLHRLVTAVNAFEPDNRHQVDISFMKFKMFGE